MERQPFIGGTGHQPIRYFSRLLASSIKGLWMSDLFKFAFVRHPLDRFVSAYFHSAEDITFKRGPHVDFKRTKADFRDFVHTLAEYRPWDIVLPFTEYPYPRRPFSVWPTHPHFIPQFYFICDPERRLLIDFIGKFENLNEDWDKVCQRLGVEGKLEHVTKSEHEPYQNYYDGKTKELVEKMYQVDMEIFGYK